MNTSRKQRWAVPCNSYNYTGVDATEYDQDSFFSISRRLGEEIRVPIGRENDSDEFRFSTETRNPISTDNYGNNQPKWITNYFDS